jgi:LPS-assembly protein
MRLPAAALLAFLAGAGSDVRAQQPDKPAQPADKPAQPAEKPAQPQESAPSADEIVISAERQEQLEKGHSRATGFVDVKAGEVRIQADRMDIYETEKPDGTKGRRLEAEGNVVFLRGDERLAGERLRLDLQTTQGVMENAVGYLQPGVFVEGKLIERVDADTYRIKGGKFTSCAQPNPRWGFTASSATIDVDKKITARNVKFRIVAPPLVNKVAPTLPLLYLPYFVYPIQEDQRSTGFLFPHFGYSSLRGFNIGSGFFWAMGRSFDQTFYVDRYSRFGYGLGHEFRYMRENPSRGTFKSYAFRPLGGAEWDYDLDWNALQTLPRGFRASLVVRQYSNLQFQNRIQDSLNFASTRTRRSALNVQGTFGPTTVQLLGDATDTIFGERTLTNRQLPTLRVARNPQKIGRTGIVFGYEARGQYLGRGDDEQVDSYSRVDLAPSFSRPLQLSFLQVTPRLNLRYTRYGATYTEEGLTGPALNRPFMESAVETRGPSFSRVFSGGLLGFYTDRIKHVIGPEFTWSYRTRVDDFTAIPKFDGFDYFLGTHQVDYALVQRLLAKRPGPSGKPIPHEFLMWRISQTYYVKIGDSQNEFDPNYSSVVFGPGGVADHNSPILSRVRFRPTGRLSSNFDLEYDVNFKQLRSLGVSGNVGYPRVNFQGGWSRAKRVARRVERRELIRDTVRGNATLQVLPGRLTLDGSGDYDLLRKTLIHYSYRVRYDVQCCGFMVETINFNFNGRSERQFRFSIELANIGSVGNFMGQEAERARQGLGGFR